MSKNGHSKKQLFLTILRKWYISKLIDFHQNGGFPKKHDFWGIQKKWYFGPKFSFLSKSNVPHSSSFFDSKCGVFGSPKMGPKNWNGRPRFHRIPKLRFDKTQFLIIHYQWIIQESIFVMTQKLRYRTNYPKSGFSIHYQFIQFLNSGHIHFRS